MSWGEFPRRRRLIKYSSSPALCTKRFWDCTTSGRNRRRTGSWLFFESHQLFSKSLLFFMTFETIRTMLIGYARVSTNEQILDLQRDALEKIGRTKIFSDVVRGAKEERKGLQEALEYVREGDTLVVWRLDRLGRSLKHLIETMTRLQ